MASQELLLECFDIAPMYARVLEAYERVRIAAHRTPVLTCSQIDNLVSEENGSHKKFGGTRLFFKCENFQRVGAFKFRGAFNAVTLYKQRQEEDVRQGRRAAVSGIIAHSSGNHAQAVALAARMLGVKACIVMPTSAPRIKVDATRGYGAEVVQCAAPLREKTCAALADEHGYEVIHPYHNLDVIAGAGTACLELMQQAAELSDGAELDYILCPVGGGGLLCGTIFAALGSSGGRTRVIACEPAGADDASRSFRSGEWQPQPDPRTIADGLRTATGRTNFEIMKRHLHDVVVADDDEILAAMRIIYERMKIVIEPSCAVVLAVALKRREELAGKRVGLIISGGNLDLTSLFDDLARQSLEIRNGP